MKIIEPQKIEKKQSLNKSNKNNTAKINIITMYPGFSYKNSRGETIVPKNFVPL